MMTGFSQFQTNKCIAGKHTFGEGKEGGHFAAAARVCVYSPIFELKMLLSVCLALNLSSCMPTASFSIALYVCALNYSRSDYIEKRTRKANNAAPCQSRLITQLQTFPKEAKFSLCKLPKFEKRIVH